jgi:hypothetical protein
LDDDALLRVLHQEALHSYMTSGNAAEPQLLSPHANSPRVRW